MKPTPLKVILIEDNPGDARLIREWLEQSTEQQYLLTYASSLKDGLVQATNEVFDVMLLDLHLPDSHGLETLNKACQVVPQMPILVLTGITDYELGIKAIQVGAQDYLIKDEISSPLLARFLRNAVERKQLLVQLQQKEEFNQSILNSLPAHVAVLNSDGTIYNVNEAWRRFARENEGDDDAYLGSNYLDLCRTAAETDPLMQDCFEGLKSVLEGKIDSFDYEYPCEIATEELWFLMKATPLQTEEGGLVMSHFDVTPLKEAEEQIRQLSQALADRNYSHYLAMSQGKGAVTSASMDDDHADKVLYDLIPDYQNLVIRYVRAIRIHEHRPSDEVQAFVRRLASLKIQARDVVRIHLGVLGEFTKDILPAQEKAFTNDARLVLLEVLGNLMDLYLTLWQQNKANIKEN